ncbi:MAG TPA: bifunctional phosphopantothenoylcysteine decarboxylase/phosphopantothenate--cysteine ligase CoaBC [Thermoplasmata archaeon]|nr:bifunctional phosphopantothenoylcysteine decarboxylase/phosphopantothenate--cysteine ligase CoaBC [Thermoplasmata archaeon]
MHPSRAIRGRTTHLLEGKRIVIGISGSIAAVEVPRIIRELLRHGADVQAVMSPEATRIITAEAVEFATGHPPILQLTGNVEHVTLFGPGEGRADLLLIAPATANSLSKIAHGIDDTALTSCASVALGGGVPILLAPAMHSHMGLNPAIRENVERLQSWGVGIIRGAAAEGEEKIASPEEIAAAVLHRLSAGPWAGRRVIVIGGASREKIDSVRSVTNESSGMMAVALATQAHFRGAEVELWAGALQVTPPAWIPTVAWEGVDDLLALARRRRTDLARATAVFVPAALSDFTLEPRSGKIPSRDHPVLTLALQRAPKVLPALRSLAPAPTRLVGFKLGSGESPAELERDGNRLREETGADWVVANDVSAMGSSETNVLVLSSVGRGQWIRGPKTEVAGKLLDDLGREVANVAHPAPSPRARPDTGSGPPRRRRGGRDQRRRGPRRP